MTHICYTLEETAEKLKLSETVLVRLSQYFKVPKAAYEEVGYLSFKGDLVFSPQDITFFQQCKERLLAGDSLDGIRSKGIHAPATGQSVTLEVPPQGASPKSVKSAGPTSAGSRVSGDDIGLAGIRARDSAPPLTQPSVPEGIREIEDSKPYEKAVERSFERYKSLHRPGLGKVFENMLKEVSTDAPRRRADATLPGFRPLRRKLNLARSGPLSRRPDLEQSRPAGKPVRHEDASKPLQAPLSGQSTWEPMIQDALSRPRALNSHLKNAAILLREKALSSTAGSADFLG